MAKDVVLDTRLGVSGIYLAGTNGDPAYPGYDDNLNTFVFKGVEARGFWARAWDIAWRYAPEVEDAFQDIVLEAIDIVSKKPEILDQEPGYLLNRATWAAQDRRYNERQGYSVATHGCREVSLDEGGTEDTEGHEAVPEQVMEEVLERSMEKILVDRDFHILVRNAVAGIEDEKLRAVAEMLAAGIRKNHIAEHLGISQNMVTRRVVKLRAILEHLTESVC